MFRKFLDIILYYLTILMLINNKILKININKLFHLLFNYKNYTLIMN